MSKSKKNVIDPESMIKRYGADAVRWFILSDSPPEKDVQWSDQGVNSAYKFLQKIYNLNNLILLRLEKKQTQDLELDFKINNYIIKITELINNFSLNVVVANVYTIYNLLFQSMEKEISNNCFKKNYCKFLKILIPFIPHIANECLEQLGEKNVDTWPEIERKININEDIKIAVQINGKTRKVIEVSKNLNEKDIMNECLKDKKLEELLNTNKILKTVFVKNKIINYLIKEIK